MKNRVAVIGGGPGGYTAALHAASLGAEVTLIERDKIGGTCLNRGCIPSKIINHSAKMLKLIQKAPGFGINIKEKPSLNLENLMKRKKNIIDTHINALLNLISINKISFIRGEAYIRDNRVLEVTDNEDKTSEILWDKLIIASGSEPSDIPSVPFDQNTIISSNDALNISDIPKSLLIIGAGVIGCEFASIFSMIGSNVTIVEALDRVLPIPGVDESCSKILAKEMKKSGIKTLLNKTVTSYQKKDGNLNVTIADYPPPLKDEKKETIVVNTDKILVCIGRKPDTKNLGLHNIGVRIDKKGWILADHKMETSTKGVYAIGDVLGPSKVMLAHAAAYEGRIAAQNAAGIKSIMNYDVIPSAIFTAPEIGNVGLTETEAKKKGFRVASESVLFRSIGKAHVIGEIEGEAKIIFDTDTQKILGVHIIGPHATDLIAEGGLAVRNQITVKELSETIHAHPTLGEIMGEVAYKAMFSS